MAFKNTRNSPDVPSAPRGERGAPTPAREGEEELLEQSKTPVHSMGHLESIEFSIEGEPYDAWMPRIARQSDGLVPVVPIKTLADGEPGLLILPGAFHSWLRREQPRRGTKLRLVRKGVDQDSGAWKLAVTRLL